MSPFIRGIAVCLSLGLLSCAKEREAAFIVNVTFEQGIRSTHVLVTARGGEVSHSTECMAIGMQRVLDVGVAQGDLPAGVTFSAEGFSNATCTSPTNPAETAAPVERTFRKGLILDAQLVLRALSPGLETNCANGIDDDNDGKSDCADLDCTDRACASGNACVAGTTCSNGVCGGGAQVMCDMPPSSCFMTGGVCVVDAGCRFLPATGTACDDHDDCTMTDRCDTTGACAGQQRACTQPPPGPCWMPTGACSRDAGCLYDPAIGASCDDNDSCTSTDVCLADGGCVGTRQSCPALPCAIPTGTCSADGGCLYTSVDAGMACPGGGACNTSGGCLPPFPFVPSNVSINDIPTPSSGKVTFNCGTTIIDSSGTGAPTINNACPGQPAIGSANITQNGGLATLVLSFQELEVSGGSTLRFVGTRPVIVVSMTNITLLGTVETLAGSQACAGAGAGANGGGVVLHSGGGGGGFSSRGGAGGSIIAGAAGGAAGSINLGTVLRGGCPGGIGGGSGERASQGGGALQLVALNTLTLAAPLNAPGQGGKGGGFGNGGNGGGSGGDLLLEAQQIIASGGSITANGGGGGESGTSNAGQDGQTSAVQALGGTDSILAGAGGKGSAAALAAVDGEVGGGGGGGGVGRIRLNVTNSCNLGVQVVVSPAATSNRPDAGCP